VAPGTTYDIQSRSWGRDTGERYEEFLMRLARESGVETPTREQLAKLDRRRPKKSSNDDWTHPHDPMRASQR